MIDDKTIGDTQLAPDQQLSADQPLATDHQQRTPAAIKVSIAFAGAKIVALLHSIAIWRNDAGRVTGIKWRTLAGDETALDHITPDMIAAIATRYISQAELDLLLLMHPSSRLADF